MKKRGIAFKLFIITCGMFTLFLAFQIGFQSLFLEKFYLEKKTKGIEKNIENFSREYLNSKWSLDKTKEEVARFAEQNNSSLIILDRYGIPQYYNEIDNYSMVVRSENGELFNVNLDALYEEESYEDFETLIGSEIYLEGILIDEDERILEAFLISSKEIETNYYDEELISQLENTEGYDLYGDEVIKIKGEVVYYNEPNFEESQVYKSDLLLQEVDSWFYENDYLIDEIDNDSIINYSYLDEVSKVENIVFIKPILYDNGDGKFIFVMTSLQPINEAIGIMNQYYIYIFLIAIIFIVLLSFLYSKMISKPLIEMNEVAKRMANLDFGAKCSIHTNDELESLSNSLNTLSKNLDQSLKELQDANDQLLDDIEKERQQEMIRREFVANVSHELKTPLGIIKGFAEGIKDGIYENKKEYYLDVIIDEINEMNRLVLDMLELSKLESKAYKLSKEVFEIEDLILKINNKFSHMVEEKKLKTTLDIQECRVCSDKNKIEQVLVNLYSNAIRYSKVNESINIKVDDRNSDVVIYIENTGVHIPEEDIEKIWDRFYRIEKSRNRASGGTGLGLLIVKNILELHNSKYGVKNTEKGVEFYFSLPKPDA